MLGQADIEGKIRMADEVIYGTDDVVALPLPKVRPRPQTTVQLD